MQKINFKLDIFEGPLDLLLHLIKKHKLNIYDIEISELLEQYLNYINEMNIQNLEISSEFFEMAAKLIYIKTCSLLPKEKEEEGLKSELTGCLLELKLIKEVANILSKKNIYGQVFARSQKKISVDMTYTKTHDKNELLKLYLIVAKKNKNKLEILDSGERFSTIVKKRFVSIESRVVYILKRLYKEETLLYDEFFNCSNKSERIATFLAMLELVKSKRICFSCDDKYIYFNKSR